MGGLVELNFYKKLNGILIFLVSQYLERLPMKASYKVGESPQNECGFFITIRYTTVYLFPQC